VAADAKVAYMSIMLYTFYSYNIGVILEGDKYCDGDDYMARSLFEDLGKE
jgi:hypothetical protein